MEIALSRTKQKLCSHLSLVLLSNLRDQLLGLRAPSGVHGEDVRGA